MIFQNRVDAGRRLAHELLQYRRQTDAIVLAIPRGGVPVAFEIAQQLELPLDVFVVRKLGVPWHPELAFGAVASGGVRVLDDEIVKSTGVLPGEIERTTASEEEELRRRERAYRGSRAPLDLKHKTVILVDDGIATGASTRAAILALRGHKPARIVLAVPVGPASTCERLRPMVDELVCLKMPQSFYAISEHYEDFSQTSDEEVTELLRRSHEALEDTGSAAAPARRKEVRS